MTNYGPKQIIGLNTSFKRSLSKLSENHKIFDIGSTDILIILTVQRCRPHSYTDLCVQSRLPDGVYADHCDSVARDNLVGEVLTAINLHMTREFPLRYCIRALLQLEGLYRERDDSIGNDVIIIITT